MKSRYPQHEQLTVVLWKWGTKYTPDHVNVLSRALKLHLKLPHLVVCITDDPAGLDADISVIPMPSELGKIHERRLWIFSEEARMLGPRILQLDIDMVITSDITDLIVPHLHDPLTVWKCEAIGRIGFALNPSLLLLHTGSHTRIWTKYLEAGEELVREANRAGCAASDQAVITYLLSTPISDTQKGRFVLTRKESIPVWTRADGIVGYRNGMRLTPENLPENTRIVSFHGPHDQANYTHLPWVREHWLTLSSQPLEVSHGIS